MNNFPEVHKYTLKKGRPVVENSIFNWSIVLKKVDSGFWVCEFMKQRCYLLLTALTQVPSLFYFFFPFLWKKRKACSSSTWMYSSSRILLLCPNSLCCRYPAGEPGALWQSDQPEMLEKCWGTLKMALHKRCVK